MLAEAGMVRKPEFVGRRKELKVLEEVWRSDRPELVVILGRRRIGKTRLMREFLREKRHIYVYVFRATLKKLLEAVTEEARKLGADLPPGYVFPDWSDFFNFVRDEGKDERLAVVFDEFHRLRDVDPYAMDILRMWWDDVFPDTLVKIFLISSSPGSVERIRESRFSPLRGRETASLKLSQLPFPEFKEAFSGANPEELVEIYAVFGGTPHYFMGVDPSRRLEENVAELVLKPYAPLREEPEGLLKSELRSVGMYMEVLWGLASNRWSLSVGEVADLIGKSRSEVYTYLVHLERLDVVGREHRASARRKPRGARFFISDNFLRFWFRYVYPNLAEVEAGGWEGVLKRFREERERFVAPVFEQIVREWLVANSGREVRDALGRTVRIPELRSVGRWWYGDAEIGVCGFWERGVVVGKALWERRKASAKDVVELAEIAEELRKREGVRGETMLLIASRSGFDASAEDALREIPSIALGLEEVVGGAERRGRVSGRADDERWGRTEP